MLIITKTCLQRRVPPWLLSYALGKINRVNDELFALLARYDSLTGYGSGKESQTGGFCWNLAYLDDLHSCLLLDLSYPYSAQLFLI